MTNTITIDVQYTFTLTPEQCAEYNKRPNSSFYEVVTDKMEAAGSEAVFQKDELTAAPVLISEVQKGKLYIVKDCHGNIYLGRAKGKRYRDTLTLVALNPKYEPTVIPVKEITFISQAYSLARQIITDEQLAEIAQMEAEHDAMFSPEQMEMIDSFLRENYGDQLPPSDPFEAIRDRVGKFGIPIISSKQLFPKDMLAEAQNPATTKDRRAQIMLAFSKGYKVVQEHGWPARRIMFIQYEHLNNEILIWVD